MPSTVWAHHESSPPCSRALRGSLPKSFTEFSPFTPAGGFLDIVLDVLREVEIHTRELLLQGGGELRGEFVLVDAARPAIEGLQGDKEFRVEEARGIGAVIRAAVLGR